MTNDLCSIKDSGDGGCKSSHNCINISIINLTVINIYIIIFRYQFDLIRQKYLGIQETTFVFTMTRNKI